MTTDNQTAQPLLATTLQGLQGDVTELAPHANQLIDEWSRALGEGHDTLNNVADELYQLKHALADGRAPEIASSLHTLSKLTKQAADTVADQNDVAQQLRQLAETLDDASARVAQSR